MQVKVAILGVPIGRLVFFSATLCGYFMNTVSLVFATHGIYVPLGVFIGEVVPVKSPRREELACVEFLRSL